MEEEKVESSTSGEEEKERVTAVESSTSVNSVKVPVQERIVEVLANGPKTTKEIIALLLREGYKSKDIEKALKELYKERKVEVAEVAGNKVLNLVQK